MGRKKLIYSFSIRQFVRRLVGLEHFPGTPGIVWPPHYLCSLDVWGGGYYYDVDITLQLQLQLHYTTLLPAVVGEVTRRPLQPPFIPSVDSLCPQPQQPTSPFRCPILKLPPPPKVRYYWYGMIVGIMGIDYYICWFSKSWEYPIVGWWKNWEIHGNPINGW